MMKRTMAILLCLLLACLAYGAPAEEPEKDEIPFKTIGDAVTDQSFIYSSSVYYVVLVKKDGAWWRVDAQVDDRFAEMYDAVVRSADPGAAYEEMETYARLLPVASAEKLSEGPLSQEILNGYTGKMMKDLLADSFGFDWAQGFSSVESEGNGSAIILRPADAAGTVYRIPFYLVYVEPGYTDGLIFIMNKGLFAYQFWFKGTEETLKKAIENGTWEELEIMYEPGFTGLRADITERIREDAYAPKFPTNEQAAAIRTVHDAEKYDFIGLYSENGDEYTLLINGTDCFWLATAKLDDRYRDLAVAAVGPDPEAAEALSDYESSLPVTVKALEAPHPPIHDLSACVGKTVRELQAEGFRISAVFASTADAEKEEYNKTFYLPDAGGGETMAGGSFSYNEYTEYLMIEMEEGYYEYTFTFDGTAETLEAALAGGTFLDLQVRKAAYSGMSSEASLELGLR